MNLSDKKLTPGQDRIIRGVARVVFVWWAVVGMLGSLMSLIAGQLVAAVLMGLFAVIGFYGWRVSKRPIAESGAQLDKLRLRLEARVNGTTDESDPNPRKQP